MYPFEITASQHNDALGGPQDKKKGSKYCAYIAGHFGFWGVHEPPLDRTDIEVLIGTTLLCSSLPS